MAGWGAQIAVSDGKNPKVYVRGAASVSGDSKWDTDWKTVAYTTDIKDPFSEVISITKSIQLTTDWQDVGISGKDLETGTYVVQVSGFDASYTNLYREIYSGVMTWFADDTNNGSKSDEIFLHNAGHAENNNAIYLRTARTNRGDDGVLHLQIAAKIAATGTDTLTFKFRRLI